jgi:hypothetical protein
MELGLPSDIKKMKKRGKKKIKQTKNIHTSAVTAISHTLIGTW